MTFKRIFPEFLKGCKIRESGWEDKKFIQLNSEFGFIIDENMNKFSLEGCHLLSADWQFFTKYFNGSKAYNLMRLEKKVSNKTIEEKWKNNLIDWGEMHEDDEFNKCYLMYDGNFKTINIFITINIDEEYSFEVSIKDYLDAEDWYLVED